MHRKYTFKITCRYNWSLLFIVLYLFEYSNVRMLGYFYLYLYRCFCGHRKVHVDSKVIIFHMSHSQFIQEHKHWNHVNFHVQHQKGPNVLATLAAT